MDRRRFLLTSLAGALAAPLAAEAQQRARSLDRLPALYGATSRANREAFLQGLRDLGYVEGRNVVIQYRDAEGSPSGSPLLRPNWFALKVDVILAGGTLQPWPPSKRPGPSPLLLLRGEPVLAGS